MNNTHTHSTSSSHTRTDIHRPSAIIAADYEYVAQECFKVDGNDFAFIQYNRALIAAHFAKTGGTYSQHEHGGNCMVCGSVNAIYTTLFYHAKSNSYVRLGADCTEKLYGHDFGAAKFRAQVKDAREHQAGKAKAQLILADNGLSAAWDINAGDGTRYEESTIKSIVGKLIQYGSISPKQVAFVASLLKKIDNRATIDAQRQEEKDAAAPCPTGRTTVSGLVLSTKTQESQFGLTFKMLVKADSGYKVWSTVPAGLAEAQKGDRVAFVVTLAPSQDDTKFGFGSRPKAVSLTKAATV